MKKKKKKNEVEHICNNCLLYNRANSTCKVAILYGGEEFHIPVFPEDKCFFEQDCSAMSPDGKKDVFKIDIEQVRWYESDQFGKKTVKMEYPEKFFGEGKEKL